MKWVLMYVVLVIGFGVLMSVAFGGGEQPHSPIITVKIERVDLAKTQTYEKGRFVYMYVAPYIYTGPRGYLFPDSKLAYIGKAVNQMYSTPWGIMYWHGTPNRIAGPVGWLPYPNLRAALAPPEPAKLPSIRYP